MLITESNIADNLSAIRQKRGLTQTDVDKKCGFSKQTTRSIEQSDKQPSLRIIIALCKALNCSSTDLIGI